MIALTELEQRELEDHFKQSPDIWVRAPSNIYLWIHNNDEAEPVCAVKFVKTELEETTIFSAQAVALDWDLPASDIYLEELVNYWTSYPIRMHIQKMLSNLDKDPELDAIKIQTMLNRRESVKPVDVPEDQSFEDGEKTILLTGGGYVRITAENGTLHASISIPASKKHSAFGPPISGFLSGTVRMHTTGRIVL